MYIYIYILGVQISVCGFARDGVTTVSFHRSVFISMRWKAVIRRYYVQYLSFVRIVNNIFISSNMSNFVPNGVFARSFLSVRSSSIISIRIGAGTQSNLMC